MMIRLSQFNLTDVQQKLSLAKMTKKRKKKIIMEIVATMWLPDNFLMATDCKTAACANRVVKEAWTCNGCQHVM